MISRFYAYLYQWESSKGRQIDTTRVEREGNVCFPNSSKNAFTEGSWGEWEHQQFDQFLTIFVFFFVFECLLFMCKSMVCGLTKTI